MEAKKTPMIEIFVMHVGHFLGTNTKDQEFLLNYCIKCVLASDCKNIETENIGYPYSFNSFYLFFLTIKLEVLETPTMQYLRSISKANS